LQEVGVPERASDTGSVSELLATHKRLDRALRLLTRCNQAVVRARSEQELLDAVCAAMVELGGYRMCWVGVPDAGERKAVKPVAWAGHVDGYLDGIDITWADEPRGRGPTGTALRTGKATLGVDFAASAELLPWRNEALRRGYRTSSALPLLHEGTALGVLTIYSTQLEAFDAAELEVLVQLTFDLSYGIHALRERSARIRADQKFEKAFQLTRDAMLLCRASDGAIAEVNEALCALTGLPRDALVGRTLRSFGALSEETLAALVRGIQADGPSELQIEFRDQAGERRTVQAFFQRAPLDGVEHVFATLRDLTEQHRHELSLRRLAAAVEQTAASVVITDERGAIEYVNPAFERITGYARAEVLGKNPRILKSGLLPDAFYKQLWTTVSAGNNWQGRLVNRDKEGRLFTEDAVIAPIRDERGAVVNYVAVQRDVTQELALHEQLFQSQKLESLGRLAGGIAHDFNNIIAVVLFAVEALQNPGLRSDSVPDIAREIGDAAIRARDLTRQLLAFARKQVFAPVPVDLNAALRMSERLLRRLLGEDITLRSELDGAAWHARCDPSQLEQVVLNLAVNARDAMPRGGRLTLTTSMLPAGHPDALAYRDLPAGDYVQLAVADTGTGIAPELQARLFEPFFTTKEAGKGTGLGLATVHGIVKQSGGSIRCESTPGAGTTFYLCLPRALPQPGPEALSPPSRRERGCESILLVEDDPHVRRVAIRALESGGYRLRVAKDGLAALEIATREPGALDLVITDVVMPGLDGGALVEELKIRCPGLPALFVSGYPDEALSDHGVLREGVEFLPKPFSGTELLARVRKILDRLA
jgi:two-component system, cell cycle sensor histidine kinase and response regulator CckA